MKTLLIKGVSRGIGAATALLAAEKGFAVTVKEAVKHYSFKN